MGTGKLKSGFNRLLKFPVPVPSQIRDKLYISGCVTPRLSTHFLDGLVTLSLHVTTTGKVNEAAFARFRRITARRLSERREGIILIYGMSVGRSPSDRKQDDTNCGKDDDMIAAMRNEQPVTQVFRDQGRWIVLPEMGGGGTTRPSVASSIPPPVLPKCNASRAHRGES